MTAFSIKLHEHSTYTLPVLLEQQPSSLRAIVLLLLLLLPVYGCQHPFIISACLLAHVPLLSPILLLIIVISSSILTNADSIHFL